MSSTKYIIAEQVLFRYYGGYIDTSGPIKRPDVYKALEQKINSLFKLRHFDVTLPSGETTPDNLMIGVYENIAVTSLNNGKSKSTLPVIPISLPKNVGIYQIYNPEFPDFPFIPLLKGQRGLLRTDSLLNDVLGQITYEPQNNTVTFSKDLLLIDCPVVTMELCVMDMSLYSETDPLPIPADFEQTIIDELMQEFMPILPEVGLVNNYTTANQKSPNP